MERLERMKEAVKMFYRPVINLDIEPPIKIEPNFEAADAALDTLVRSATTIMRLPTNMENKEDWVEKLEELINEIPPRIVFIFMNCFVQPYRRQGKTRG